jgi:hypothetical protein
MRNPSQSTGDEAGSKSRRGRAPAAKGAAVRGTRRRRPIRNFGAATTAGVLVGLIVLSFLGNRN